MLIVYDLPVQKLVARTIYGEARGEGIPGMEAVGAVIQNRVRRPSWWGENLQTVCLKPSQFSCWNRGDANRNILLSEDFDNKDGKTNVYKYCVMIAEEVINDTLPDITLGAHFYHTKNTNTIFEQRNIKPVYEYKNHVFYA